MDMALLDVCISDWRSDLPVALSDLSSNAAAPALIEFKVSKVNLSKVNHYPSRSHGKKA